MNLTVVLAALGLVLGLTLALGGCPAEDDDDSAGNDLQGDQIECDWFDGDNCWKATVAAAAPCAAPDEVGVMTADGTSCSFSDGTTVTFHTPVPEDYGTDFLWDFTIDQGGSSCMSLSQASADELSVTTDEGTYAQSLVGLSMQIECPSGDAYYISALAMFDCDFGAIPGVSFGTGGGAAAVSLLGGADGAVELFHCAQ